MVDLFDRLLVTCPNGGGLFLLDRGVLVRLDSLDSTGLVVHGQRFGRAIQPAGLVLVDGTTCEVDTSAARLGDLHDVYADGDSYYVVSTYGNEIVRFDAHGEQSARWSFPGEPDAWHVNCVTRWHDRIVFSAFGDRRVHRAYKKPPLDAGFVQDLEGGERLITGLFQPHSLVVDGGRLLLAESGRFAVREYDTCGSMLREQRFNGYTRGIARVDGVLYVGLSKSRNVDVPDLSAAAIVALDAATWKELGRMELPVDEVYAIQPVEVESALHVVARLASHASGVLSAKAIDAAAEAARARDREKLLADQVEAVARDRDDRQRENDRRVYGLLETVQGKDVQIQNRDELIREKDAEVQRRDKLLAEAGETLTRREDQLRTQVQEKERQVFGLLETVQGKDVQIQNRDELIREKDAEVRRRDKLLAEAGARLAQREGQLRAQVQEKERQVFGLLETVQGKDIEIRNRDELIREKDAEVRRRDKLLADAGETLARREEQLRRQVQQEERQVLRLTDTVRRKDVQIENRDDSLRERVHEIAGLTEALQRKDMEVDRLTASVASISSDSARLVADLRASRARLDAQATEIAALQRGVDAVRATLSWRITTPLRGVRAMGVGFGRLQLVRHAMGPVNKARHVVGTLRATLGDPERRERYLTLARVLGPRAALHHTVAFLRRGGPRPRAPIPAPIFDLREGLHRKAVILTTRHCDFVAALIQHALTRVGVASEVIHERPAAGYADLPHFVICPQMFDPLPGLYTAFQMEQSVSTRWFTPRYIDKLEHSFAILDYAVANIDALVARGLHRKQFFYMPLGYLPGYGRRRAGVPEDYDVVFYGDVNNDRRRSFIAALNRVCRVKVICEVYGDALRAELARAKLIVNIHYYEGALLETTRLWECVSLDKLVVSERAANMDENRDLEQLVDFVDVGDLGGMVRRVQHWLRNDSARAAKLEANRKLAEALPNRFEYFFYRFMLAFDNLTFFRFWQLAGSKLTLSGNRLCLNLPEYTQRRSSFDADNHFGFQVFPGLRHRDGWVGCGLSYKLMIMLARQQKLQRVTICEDDVEFHERFDQDFAAVLHRLQEDARGWDVFSGLLGDLHADAVIKRISDVNGHRLVETNRLISTVFNVYNRRVFDRVSLWDECDRDVIKNTIDRYMEGTRLKVLACHPFLVGHKSELNSTLWGVGNDTMISMIQRSEELLGAKIDEFTARAVV